MNEDDSVDRPQETSLLLARCTDRTRRVLALARREADERRLPQVGSVQLLLGLMHEGQGVGGAVLLSIFDVTADRVRSLGHGEDAASDADGEYVARLLERALEEARALRHNFIGTEHLLLAVAGEPDSAGRRVLNQLGAAPDAVREAVLSLLGHGR